LTSLFNRLLGIVKVHPRVAAVSSTEKHKKHVTYNLKFDRLSKVVKTYVREKFQQAKCSGS